MGYEFVIRRQRGCFGELLADVANGGSDSGKVDMYFFKKENLNVFVMW